MRKPFIASERDKQLFEEWFGGKGMSSVNDKFENGIVNNLTEALERLDDLIELVDELTKAPQPDEETLKSIYQDLVTIRKYF